jgi:putative membrane protein
MVLAFTGPLGLFVLAVSTAIGMIAPLTGIRRSHGMGVLLLPVIVMLW